MVAWQEAIAQAGVAYRPGLATRGRRRGGAWRMPPLCTKLTKGDKLALRCRETLRKGTKTKSKKQGWQLASKTCSEGVCVAVRYQKRLITATSLLPPVDSRTREAKKAPRRPDRENETTLRTTSVSNKAFKVFDLRYTESQIYSKPELKRFWMQSQNGRHRTALTLATLFRGRRIVAAAQVVDDHVLAGKGQHRAPAAGR